MKSLSLEEYRPSLLLELFQSSGQVDLAVAPQSPATPAFQTYSFILDHVNIWKNAPISALTPCNNSTWYLSLQQTYQMAIPQAPYSAASSTSPRVSFYDLRIQVNPSYTSIIPTIQPSSKSSRLHLVEQKLWTRRECGEDERLGRDLCLRRWWRWTAHDFELCFVLMLGFGNRAPSSAFWCCCSGMRWKFLRRKFGIGVLGFGVSAIRGWNFERLLFLNHY